MQIHQSAEDYLETILMLSQRMGKVRSIDVVNELGFTKASVSIAMKKLRENGYIAVDGEGNLTLLEPGQAFIPHFLLRSKQDRQRDQTDRTDLSMGNRIHAATRSFTLGRLCAVPTLFRSSNVSFSHRPIVPNP